MPKVGSMKNQRELKHCKFYYKNIMINEKELEELVKS